MMLEHEVTQNDQKELDNNKYAPKDIVKYEPDLPPDFLKSDIDENPYVSIDRSPLWINTEVKDKIVCEICGMW